LIVVATAVDYERAVPADRVAERLQILDPPEGFARDRETPLVRLNPLGTDSMEKTVWIHFTDTFNFGHFRKSVKITPPLWIRWYESIVKVIKGIMAAPIFATIKKTLKAKLRCSSSLFTATMLFINGILAETRLL